MKSENKKYKTPKTISEFPHYVQRFTEFRSTYLVEELLKDGASVDEFTCMKTSSPLRLNKIEEDRFRLWGEYSAIHLAVSLGQYEILSLLLDNGADLSSKTTKGVKLLDLILNPHLRCILDEMRSRANIFEKDDLEMLKIMKKNGVDLNKMERISKTTVLHRAITYNSREILRYLISAGVDVNCVDGTNCTPLHYCTCNNVESGRILLQSDANPNAQDTLGNTICHLVFRGMGYGGRVETKTFTDFVDLLHKRNANPNIQNDLSENSFAFLPYSQ